MSPIFINSAPVPALAGLMQALQTSAVPLATIRPIVSEIQGLLAEPGAMGMNPTEVAQVQFALEDLDRAASRFSRGSDHVASISLQPTLASLVGSWPVRLYALDDITRHFVVQDEAGAIGEGGCGKVRSGFHPEEATHVIIKEVNVPDERLAGVSSAHFYDLLRHEFAILRGLREGTGPRVWPYSLGTLNGSLCLVMEQLEGEDLGRWREGFFHRFSSDYDLDQLLQVCRQAVQAVAHLHEQGLVHCDVKPDNFIYNERTKPKFRRTGIIDFGIACQEGERHVLPSGTPEFLAPECWNPENANGFGRDVFALGVTLYWLISGHYPFDGESLETLRDNILNPDFEVMPPSEILLRSRPDLAASLTMDSLIKWQLLDDVVMRALRRDESLRFYEAGEMLEELERGLRDSEVVVVADGGSVGGVSIGE